MSVFGIVILAAATVLGIGLATLDEANTWSRTSCVMSDLNSVEIVNASCAPANAFVVLLRSSSNFSVYLSDPVSSYAQAQSQLAALVLPINASCWKKTGETLQYPLFCDTCSLVCSNFSLSPQYLESSSIANIRPTAFLYISIGSPITGVFVVGICVFLTLYQMREDALRKASSLIQDDAGGGEGVEDNLN